MGFSKRTPSIVLIIKPMGIIIINGGGPMKLLIIEDSTFVRKTIIGSLRKFMPENEFIEATDGRDGIEKYKAQNPDVIITDLLMPQMSGQELIKAVREEDKEVPIIVLSADVQETVKAEVFEMGVLDFLNKPMNGNKAKLITKLIKEHFND